MTTETSESKDLKFEHWCVVELMGHQRIAGLVTEQNLFGGALMRVDVPEVEGRPGFTKFFGASSIYAVTPVEETVARAMAKSFDTRPVEEWRLSGLLPASAPSYQIEDEFDFAPDDVPLDEGENELEDDLPANMYRRVEDEGDDYEDDL